MDKVNVPQGHELNTMLIEVLRIRQLGTRSIMGVPGDMNLELLDYVKEVEGLAWS